MSTNYIDEVSVVDIRSVSTPNSVDAYMAQAKEAPTVRLTGADCQRVLQLWSDLETDEQMRCHTPPFGLRFYSRGSLVGEVSVCWECNNIFGEVLGGRYHRMFNGYSSSAREPLGICKQMYQLSDEYGPPTEGCD